MTLPLALLLIAVAVMALAFLYLTGTAPEGWQDANGWHAGREGWGGDVHTKSDTIR